MLFDILCADLEDCFLVTAYRCHFILAFFGMPSPLSVDGQGPILNESLE